MKLRIRSNSIRLRLTQSEVKKLKEFGLVEEFTEFTNNQIFTYSLTVSDNSDKITADFTDGKITIFLPKSITEYWTNSDEVGIYESIDKLQIIVEKDFKCLTPRVGDEDIDTFPHPKESHNC